MGQAIGHMLPAAVAIAISPPPIIAVILILVSPRAATNAPAYLLGWFGGLAVVGAVVLALSDGAGASVGGAPATWVNWLTLIIGSALVLLAFRQWRERPRGGEEPSTPKWMAAIDDFSPLKAARAGVVLTAANPKTLLFTVAGVEAIAQTGISTGEQIVAYVTFIVIASIGVAAPVAISVALGKRSQDLLERLETWFVFNNAVIMSVLLLVIGAKLIGDAIAGFTT
jgi:threonine/homoserine/homoserine lactone efflux protein